MASKPRKLRPYQRENIKEYNKVRGAIKRQITLGIKKGWHFPEYVFDYYTADKSFIPTKRDIKKLRKALETREVFKYARILSINERGQPELVSRERKLELETLWRGRKRQEKELAKKGFQASWDENGNLVVNKPIMEPPEITQRKYDKNPFTDTKTYEYEPGGEYYDEVDSILNWIEEGLNRLIPTDMPNGRKRTAFAADAMQSMVEWIKSEIVKMKSNGGDYQLYAEYLRKNSTKIGQAMENFTKSFYREEIMENGHELIDLITGFDLVRTKNEKEFDIQQQARTNITKDDIFQQLISEYIDPATGELSPELTNEKLERLKTEAERRYAKIVSRRKRMEQYEDLMSELTGFEDYD